MGFISILAAAVQTGNSRPSGSTVANLDILWTQITSLGLLEALTFMAFGVVCLFYGWRIFKVLVVIAFAFIGLWLGVIISSKVGGGSSPLLGIILCILLGALSIPMMKWGVSILGALAGAIVTGGLWYAFKLPEAYLWAGAIFGLIAGGMISFIVFKVAIMLFSSLGGSALIITGILAILHMYPQTSAYTKDMLYTTKWFLPVIVIVPTFIGVFVQNKFVKGSSNWSV